MSAVNVYSTESGLVAMVIDLIGRLVSIPSQVGLDARSVVISLQVCSALNVVSTKPSDDSVQLLNGVCHLLSAVVRNHTSVAGACPAAVINGHLTPGYATFPSSQHLQNSWLCVPKCCLHSECLHGYGIVLGT